MARKRRSYSRTFLIKESGGTLITTVRAQMAPLTSAYVGLEVPQTEIKNTSLFLIPWNLGSLVAQGDYVWTPNLGSSWQITGYKAFEDHTEIVGLAS